MVRRQKKFARPAQILRDSSTDGLNRLLRSLGRAQEAEEARARAEEGVRRILEGLPDPELHDAFAARTAVRDLLTPSGTL